MPHKANRERSDKVWEDRSPDSFRPFPHPEAYDSWKTGDRQPDSAAGSSSKGRYVPPAVRKKWDARNAVERGYDDYVENQYPTRSGRQPSPVREDRGYSPSMPAELQSEAASYPSRNGESSRRVNAGNYARGERGNSIPPEQRRYPSRALEEPTTSRRTRDNTPQPKFQPFLPSPTYVALSRKPARSDPPKISPKLLVLDLNGTLVYRTSSNAPPHPRPYLSSFLQYLFLPEPKDAAGKVGQRPWEAFVWSSAQPHNVRKMVTAAFGERWIRGLYDAEDGVETVDERDDGEGRLMGVWARDKMNLSSSDYSRKVQTVKDLRILLDHLSELRSRSLEEVPEFDESNTVLLDDSPLKAVHQPWSQLIIPEYGHVEYSASKNVAKQSDDHPPASVNGLDVTLLAVIGILEELRTVDSVPAWIRTEGLISFGPDGPPRTSSINVKDEPTLETLPSHDGFLHWHKNMAIVEHWRLKGLAALERKGIVADIGPVANADWRGSRATTPQRESRRPARDTPERERRAATRDTPDREALSPQGSIIPVPSLDSPQKRSSPSARPPSPPLRPGGGPLPRRPASPPPNRPDPPAGRRYLHSTDSWRTFRASDVALYLQDVADRPSSLSAIQRQTLLNTIATLESLGPSTEWEDGDLEELRGGHWDGHLCDSCTAVAGGLEDKRLQMEATKGRNKGLKIAKKLMRMGTKAEAADKRKEALQAEAIPREERTEVMRFEVLPRNIEQETASEASDDESMDEVVVTRAVINGVVQPPPMLPVPAEGAELPDHQSAAVGNSDEAEFEDAARKRAICKYLCETIRARCDMRLSTSIRDLRIFLHQLEHAHGRLLNLQKSDARFGGRALPEFSDIGIIAPFDRDCLAQAQNHMNRRQPKTLAQLGVSEEDFFAGLSIPPGTVMVRLERPSTPKSSGKEKQSSGKRKRSGSNATSMSARPMRKRDFQPVDPTSMTRQSAQRAMIGIHAEQHGGRSKRPRPAKVKAEQGD